jgi:hypothetical protein
LAPVVVAGAINSSATRLNPRIDVGDHDLHALQRTLAVARPIRSRLQ